MAILGESDYKKITPGHRKSSTVGISTSELYRRNITKLAGGAVVDWNSGPIVKGIEKAVLTVNRRGAMRVKRLAMGIVRNKAYWSGDLMKSIKVSPSKYSYGDWVVSAGNEKVDYAMHIETGWYFITSQTKKTRSGKTGGGKWIYAQPYMRPAAASTRKWIERQMVNEIRRVIK